MDKNTVTGFILIALVLIVFSWWTRPSEEQMRQQQIQDSIAQVAKTNAEKRQKAEEAKLLAAKKEAEEDSTSLFYSALKGEEQKIVLKNGKVELTLNSKGATVEKAVVKGFKDRNGRPDVTLFEGKDQSLNYTLVAKETNISTQRSAASLS